MKPQHHARLGERRGDVDAPGDGLDERDRGNLLHALMANLWGVLKVRSRLDVVSAGELAKIIEDAAARAIAKIRAQRPGVLDGRLAELEAARLAKLAREWLEVERARDDFEVVATEDRRTLQVAGLSFTGRIDRMDWLPGAKGGGHVLIDYKTGRATSKDWLEERPDDPQMPLYALGAAEKITAIAYARVKTGDMKFIGIAERTPKARASYEAAATTPRDSAEPPTTTGFPRNSG